RSRCMTGPSFSSRTTASVTAPSPASCWRFSRRSSWRRWGAALVRPFRALFLVLMAVGEWVGNEGLKQGRGAARVGSSPRGVWSSPEGGPSWKGGGCYWRRSALAVGPDEGEG